MKKKLIPMALVFILGFAAALFATTLIAPKIADSEVVRDGFGRKLPITKSELERFENNQSTQAETEAMMSRLKKFGEQISERAITNDEIVYFYKDILKDKAPNAAVSVKERTKLGNTDYEKVIVEIDVLGQKLQDFVFVHKQYILPDIIDVPRAKSLKENELKEIESVKKSVLDERVLEAFKDEKNVVSLGKKGQWGKEMIVFSDPECPYCRKHLQGIDERFLQDNRIHFIFASVHGKTAFEKIALIYKETQEASSDSAKLKIIKKYYDDDVKYTPPSEDERKAAEILFSKYMLMGLRQVPYIIEIDER